MYVRHATAYRTSLLSGEHCGDYRYTRRGGDIITYLAQMQQGTVPVPVAFMLDTPLKMKLIAAPSLMHWPKREYTAEHSDWEKAVHHNKRDGPGAGIEGTCQSPAALSLNRRTRTWTRVVGLLDRIHDGTRHR
jgi:hypothetical protein